MWINDSSHERKTIRRVEKEEGLNWNNQLVDEIPAKSLNEKRNVISKRLIPLLRCFSSAKFRQTFCSSLKIVLHANASSLEAINKLDVWTFFHVSPSRFPSDKVYLVSHRCIDQTVIKVMKTFSSQPFSLPWKLFEPSLVFMLRTSEVITSLLLPNYGST